MLRRARHVSALTTLWLVGAAACTSGANVPPVSSSSARIAGRADIGGYELVYQCEGTGSPTVILEGGYGVGGTSQFPAQEPVISRYTRVCSYDRAGTGASDPRPSSLEPVTGLIYARELRALLEAIRVPPPYVMVGHSFGGMIVRTFTAAYPSLVTGMVLIDASSEPEIGVYRRFHAGAWIDHTSKVDIDEMVRELQAAPSLGDIPLAVLTAGIQEDPTLKRVPQLETRFQARLATLSTDSVHVLAKGDGHFIQKENPDLVDEAVRQVVMSARSGDPLPPCPDAFPPLGAECL
jgi:pimeloyl-ACP methyl ester carboxylesterase